MSSLIQFLKMIYGGVFNTIERFTHGWLLGLVMRLTFASVLLGYYLNSAATKVNSGFMGFFHIADSAYIQIIPSVMEGAGYNTSDIAVFPWKFIVAFGTYSEFILPVLIVLGLFTRLAAFAMMGFVCVQTYVDIFHLGAAPETIGAFFDNVTDSAIVDQRLLWLTILLYLAVRGAGHISLDALFNRLTSKSPPVFRPRKAM